MTRIASLPLPDYSALPDYMPRDIPVPPEPADRESREAALREALEHRILVLDGATGTALQNLELTADDFGGPDLEGCNEMLCLLKQDAVDHLHVTYLDAGADIVETNTFGGTPLVLEEYGQGDKAFDINHEAARLAREACARYDKPGRLHFVCGSMGPTTKAISVTGGVTFEELIENYRIQALGLMAGGADYLLLETAQDTRNVKAGLIGIEQAFDAAGWRVPVAVSVTVEAMGTMLAGQDAEALAVSLLHVDLLYVGLNCATGPELMTDHLRDLAELVRAPVACVPNAGLPDEDGVYQEGPDDFRKVFTRFFEAGWLNLVGGCCGTTPEHVTALVELASRHKPRIVAEHHRSLVSGLEAVELTADNRPLLVGERTNVLGSRKFKRLIASGDYEAAAEVGRAQVKAGAQVIDVCLQDPERDEIVDIELFLDRLTRLVRAPLMIDSTDPAVMERALTWCQGKAVLNSINLEDGLDRFQSVLPLAKRYGAALVVGLIDETGMAVSLERKLEVARRSYQLLTEDYGIAPEDIWWDALVFPCATGDENYWGSGAATIESVRRLKQEMPDTKTILGVSNVSFGLPNAGREVLNSVFLYHCTQAGLDAAIVNTQKLARYAEIPEDERKLAEHLIFLDPTDIAGGQKGVEEFTEHFRGRKTAVVSTPREDLPLAERLSRAIVEGSKVGLDEDIAAALADDTWPDPLAIINGPLMKGMAEVGRLFNDNQLIVAEVLQSAEVMKAAVALLEPHMEKAEGSGKGKIVLATVKGDVHDIGKNLVDIILSNNGFEVVNLGIKVPSEQLIQAIREHQPDLVGLSGLLVKSAQQMVITAGDMAAVGIDVPLLVGGAALTRRFTHRKIAAAYNGLCTYAKDAMHGLDLVERLMDGAQRPALEDEIAQLITKDVQQRPGVDKPAAGEQRRAGEARSDAVRVDVPVPKPSDLDRHTAELDLDDVWQLLNLQMLYGKHMGLRGSIKALEAKGDAKLARLQDIVGEVQQIARDGGMTCRAVWRFFPARGEGNTLRLFDPESGDLIAEWEIPRQAGGDNLCLTDYVLQDDHVGLFVTTAGAGVREQAEAWKQAGEYVKSHAMGSLAVETAEAAAEWVHRAMRTQWGLSDAPGLTPQDLFASRYQGKRYSFGYPACPDLTGQRQLFTVLQPEDIGVELTDGDMMDPEASVSALVFHHPDCRYYGA